MNTYLTSSREETIKLGEKIAAKLKAGDMVALNGELGSGKTTFIKGLAKGLGVKKPEYVNSPSFVIIKEYRGRIPLYHFDVFRLDSPSELDTLGLEEYFYKNGICAIEWAEKIRDLLPKNHIDIKIEILENNRRRIKFSVKSKGKRKK
ncbi:MAG: tRNA (adenosine(37)-N6)-threonylcarbamoyltransferase complex ATPase subunit type 1 TsaE [Candidatus Omnitrophica bacterium]|nr:tRNA (adenosine(37)-N6)-threonylcarbamoyltransferase complex ATPase subunit type 1 TsaE [Candidatus Omnitrophota bacterium]